MGQVWPKPYLAGRDQAYRLAVQERAEWLAGKLAQRPASHEVKEDRMGAKKKAWA